MNAQGLGQEEVYRALLDRIQNGSYRPGTKLPSCRAFAADIGSNPNTVHRALKSLEEEGVVRTVARKGSFVTDVAVSRHHGHWLADEVGRLAARASIAGVDPTTLRHMLDKALAEVAAPPTVLFTECNSNDLAEMAQTVEGVSGLRLQAVLLDDLEESLASVDDAIIMVPLFHLGEVRGMDVGDTSIVELSFVPESESLLELASLDPTMTVTVASRYPRGVERLASLVRQYFGGPVDERLLAGEKTDLSDVEMLVYNNGSRLHADELASAPATLKLSVALDGNSASSLRGRLDGLLRGQPSLET